MSTIYLIFVFISAIIGVFVSLVVTAMQEKGYIPYNNTPAWGLAIIPGVFAYLFGL
jgi:hypothetical protein